ncbi:MAG: Rne/Rng family ribonuclease [Clostridia bacterium]|nr:Rne/Rng family ribonuclease [Clostridia bacterium]
MKEIIINYNNHKSDIVVLENGRIVEKYQEYDNNKTIEGNIYLGQVINVLPGMGAAFVDIGEEKNAFLHIKDVLPKASEITGNKNEKIGKSDIKKYVKVGMPIIVQVKKDKNETKGARISTDLNIAGKYIALVPNSKFITVSSKLEDKQEITRLKQIVKNNSSNENGFIIRTAAQNKTKQELIKDINNVENIYNNIKKKATKYKEANLIPQKLYEAGGIANKVLLGLIDNTDKITVNNENTYNFICEEYIGAKEILKLDTEKNLITEDITNQIEKLKNRKIWLNCGGFITIDKTEALTAIDVNTGKYTGKESLEKTVLKVNEEATIEIAKQIKARDIGGILIIDYIDMEEKEDENKIVDLLKRELKKDRAKTQVVGFTPLHLLEMTRKHLCSN